MLQALRPKPSGWPWCLRRWRMIGAYDERTNRVPRHAGRRRQLVATDPGGRVRLSGTIPTSVAAQRAEVVFVGTVRRIDRPQPISRQSADGSRHGGREQRRAQLSRIRHRSHFQGTGVVLVEIGVVQGNSSCDLPFQTNEVWLLLEMKASEESPLTRCLRTRLTSDASQDLVYLKGAEAKRPQGIVYGEVFRRRDGPSEPSCTPSLSRFK